MFVKAFEEMLSKSQAFDRWSLLSLCLPRGYVFSGLVTMYGPGSTRILEKKKEKEVFFLVFVWTQDPTSLLALTIRTPVANTGKLRSIGQMPVA